MNEVDRLRAEVDALIEAFPLADDISPIEEVAGRFHVQPRAGEGGIRVCATKAEAVRWAFLREGGDHE